MHTGPIFRNQSRCQDISMNQQIHIPVIGEATSQPGTAATRHDVFMESRLWIMRNVTRETRMGKITLEQDKEEASYLKWHQ